MNIDNMGDFSNLPINSADYSTQYSKKGRYISKHGVDIAAELSNIMSDEIRNEIDTELIRNMISASKAFGLPYKEGQYIKQRL